MKRRRISTRMHKHVGDGAVAASGRSNGNGTVTAPSHGGPHLTLAPARPWSHTLVLRGDLDHHSAAELEDELVCLLEEGVTALTLDLRQIDELDPRGAQVIALQSALFKGKGRRLSVLVGSPAVQCALAATGEHDLLRSERAQRREDADDAADQLRLSSGRAGGDLSTTVTRELGPA